MSAYVYWLFYGSFTVCQTYDVSELSKAVRNKLTAAALDMGGGSTQVTFRPREEETELSAPGGHVHDVRIFGENIRLYTHRCLYAA